MEAAKEMQNNAGGPPWGNTENVSRGSPLQLTYLGKEGQKGLQDLVNRLSVQ